MTEAGLKLSGKHELAWMKTMQAFIALRGSQNSFESSDIPAEKQKLAGKILRPISDYRINQTRWVVLRWPTPAMAQAIDVLAKLNPKAAKRMTDGKSDTIVRALRKAIKALGLPALLARLEYAALTQDDDSMKFWRTTLGRKLAPLLTVDAPMVRGMDEAAAESAERIEASGGVDLKAEAASAWFDMTQRRGWKDICLPGGAPNRPGDFGKPDRWDLSDTAEEHDRRVTAFVRSGAISKWQMCDAQGRIEFRDRWIGFYVEEVTE
jgi:hypothetical protein